VKAESAYASQAELFCCACDSQETESFCSAFASQGSECNN